MRLGELVPGVNRLFQGLSPDAPLKGWGYLRWGQDYDDVRRYFPQARAEDFKLVLGPEQPVELPYKISLAFDAGHQLESVTLTFAGSRETADFAALSERLTQQFGAPISSSDNTTTWSRDETQAVLSDLPDGGVALSKVV
jgi:hypothetical protein